MPEHLAPPTPHRHRRDRTLQNSRQDILDIATFAALSRLLLIIIAAISYLACNSYDQSTLAAGAAHNDQSANQQRLHLDVFVRWDAVFFEGIADRGYTYEQEFAFFPGFPVAMRVGGGKCNT